jgi:hypothetical protein
MSSDGVFSRLPDVLALEGTSVQIHGRQGMLTV